MHFDPSYQTLNMLGDQWLLHHYFTQCVWRYVPLQLDTLSHSCMDGAVLNECYNFQSLYTVPVISRHKLSNKAIHKRLLKAIEETLSYPIFYKRRYSKFYSICMYMGNFERVKILPTDHLLLHRTSFSYTGSSFCQYFNLQLIQFSAFTNVLLLQNSPMYGTLSARQSTLDTKMSGRVCTAWLKGGQVVVSQ